MSSPKLNLVVAACNNNGIGINGKLPWTLRKDMDFFKMITAATTDPGKQNAVIMGRKTWFSIPEKFRPLRNRINIVLSRELKELPEGVYLARSLQEAVTMATTGELSSKIQNLHVIGGQSVYKEAMEKFPCRLYLTRVLADFECDTFLPEVDADSFCKIPNPDNVTTDLMEENGIKFRFEVYDKPITNRNSNLEAINLKSDSQHTPIRFKDSKYPPMESNMDVRDQPMKSKETESDELLKITTQKKAKDNGLIKFDITVAMCHTSRGIGLNNGLPWPELTKDKQYYRTLSTSRQREGEGKIVQIYGRHTWFSVPASHHENPNIYYIVVSKTLDRSAGGHPRLLSTCRSFQEAVDHCNKLDAAGELDSVWIMGGAGIYQAAMDHPQCGRLYVTHVYQEFTADAFCPRFEHMFKEIKNDVVEQTRHEDHGVSYEFKIYEKSK